MKKLFALLSLIFLLIIALPTPVFAVGEEEVFKVVGLLLTVTGYALPNLIITLLIIHFSQNMAIISIVLFVNIILFFIMFALFFSRYSERISKESFNYPMIAFIWCIINLLASAIIIVNKILISLKH